MLKTLFRIAVILLFAGAIAGGLYLYAASAGPDAGSQSSDAARHSFGQSESSAADPLGRQYRGGGSGGLGAGRGRDAVDGDFSIEGLNGILGQAGKVALITLVVVGLQAITRRIRRGRRRPSGMTWVMRSEYGDMCMIASGSTWKSPP